MTRMYTPTQRSRQKTQLTLICYERSSTNDPRQYKLVLQEKHQTLILQQQKSQPQFVRVVTETEEQE